MKVNPFVGFHGSSTVNSGALTPVLKPCPNRKAASTGRRRRSAPNVNNTAIDPSLGLFTSIDVGVNLNNIFMNFINSTSDDPYGMIYHVYNLSSPGRLNIQIQVRPFDDVNETLNVYAMGDVKPTPRVYRWFLGSYWANVSSGVAINGTTVPDISWQLVNNYTLLLSPNETTNFTKIIIGVQSTTGNN